MVATSALWSAAALQIPGTSYTNAGEANSRRAGSDDALMGAVAGGLIGSLSGNRGKGALIGAGVGGVSGYLVDKHRKGHIG